VLGAKVIGTSSSEQKLAKLRATTVRGFVADLLPMIADWRKPQRLLRKGQQFIKTHRHA